MATARTTTTSPAGAGTTSSSTWPATPRRPNTGCRSRRTSRIGYCGGMEAAPAEPIALHRLLRARTAAAHTRLDAGFAGGFRDALAYDAYLAGMARFLDHAIAVMGAEAWLLEARAALAADLGLPAPPPTPVPVQDDDARLVGWRYVVAGATLGARVLLRQASALDDG